MVLRLTGGRTIEARPDTVWHALHDVDFLGACLPNCLSLQRASPTRYTLTLLVPFGPVSIPFDGVVEICAEDVPERLRLHGQGNGGLAGRAEGFADITLRPTREGCRLIYVVEAKPSGPLAVVGTLLLSRVGRELADRFVAEFAEAVARGARVDPSDRVELATTA